MTRDSDSPGTEFKVAVAGPVVTLVLAAAFTGIGIALSGGDEFWQALTVEEGADSSGALAVVSWLASINMLVLIFNLIPAFPWTAGGSRARSRGR